MEAEKAKRAGVALMNFVAALAPRRSLPAWRDVTCSGPQNKFIHQQRIVEL
jgi:hypothetical protein